jgi:hypothetical protein
MSPIEEEVPQSVIEAISKTVPDLEYNAMHAYMLTVKDLLTEHIARLLLTEKHPDYTLDVRGGIRALQIGDEVYPIEMLKKNGNEEPLVYIILRDGNIHKIKEEGNRIQIAIWSEMDGDGHMFPFSDDLRDSHLDAVLNLTRPEEVKNQLDQPLVGPNGLGSSSTLINSFILWDIHSDKLKSSLLSLSMLSAQLSVFHDLVVDTYTS